MTVAEYLLPVWLAALRRRHPGAAVALTAGNSAEVAAAVLGAAADLGFVEGPVVPAGLDARQVGRDTLMLVVAPGHRWARRRRGVSAAAELAATSLLGQGGRARAPAGTWTKRCAAAGLAVVPRPSSPRRPRSSPPSQRAPGRGAQLARGGTELSAGTLRRSRSTGLTWAAGCPRSGRRAVS